MAAPAGRPRITRDDKPCLKHLPQVVLSDSIIHFLPVDFALERMRAISCLPLCGFAKWHFHRTVF
jgi:hypothetical protein